MTTITAAWLHLAGLAERCRRGTHGATSAEYALLVAFVFAVIVLAVKVFGGTISDLLGRYPDLSTAS